MTKAELQDGQGVASKKFYNKLRLDGGKTCDTRVRYGRTDGDRGFPFAVPPIVTRGFDFWITINWENEVLNPDEETDFDLYGFDVTAYRNGKAVDVAEWSERRHNYPRPYERFYTLEEAVDAVKRYEAREKAGTTFEWSGQQPNR